jgi:hypothetical protein
MTDIPAEAITAAAAALRRHYPSDPGLETIAWEALVAAAPYLAAAAGEATKAKLAEETP